MSCSVVGFILAGGRGQRMGLAHKGLLRHPTKGTILAHLLDELKAAGVERVVLVVGGHDTGLQNPGPFTGASRTGGGHDPNACIVSPDNPYAAFGLPSIADLRKGQGPLGGVEAALRHLRDSGLGQAALFLPCDVPAITRREIAALLDAFARDPRGVKVAAVAGESRLHALCCVVGVDVLPAVQEALDEGRQKISELWRRLGAQAVEFPDAQPFVNVNTPEELSGWLGKRGHSTFSSPDLTCPPGEAIPNVSSRGREGDEKVECPLFPRLHVQPELREKVLPLIAAGRLAVQVVVDGPCDIRIVGGHDTGAGIMPASGAGGAGERAGTLKPCIVSPDNQGSTDVLYAGGWIACPTAWGLAEKHGLPLAALGELLDALDIRVRHCALGCFP